MSTNESSSFPIARRQALLALLDDAAPSVRKAVREELQRHGKDSVALLRQAQREFDGDIKKQAELLLRELFGEDSQRVFLNFIRSTNYELETGMLLLERSVDDSVEPQVYRQFLDEVADRCRELLVHPSTAWEKCRTINRVIFGEYGFCGDVDHFYDPQNSLLSKVIERRRGLPLSLSVLYLLVADRCGLELSPVAMPGRFMVGCFLDSEPFYIDPFEGGVFREATEIQVMLRSHHIEPDPAYMAPCPVGEVLLRCCRNLVRQYRRYGNEDNATLFATFVAEFETIYNSRP